MNGPPRSRVLAKENVVGAVGFEGRVQVYEVDGLVRDVVAEDVRVVAVVEDVGLHREAMLAHRRRDRAPGLGGCQRQRCRHSLIPRILSALISHHLRNLPVAHPQPSTATGGTKSY